MKALLAALLLTTPAFAEVLPSDVEIDAAYRVCQQHRHAVRSDTADADGWERCLAVEKAWVKTKQANDAAAAKAKADQDAVNALADKLAK